MPNYSGKWTPSQILQARGQDLWPINGPFFYVDDVFSTYLYTGDSGTQSISNGIDLDGEGGLVWIKGRTAAYDNGLYDTARGATKEIYSNKTDAEQTNPDTVTSFNSDGFSIGADPLVNTNLEDYVSWSFRKQAGFFDVVTYTGTGTGTGERTINHNLGSTPGVIILKDTSAAGNWIVYHRDGTNSGNYKKNLVLNSTTDESSNNFWVNAGITDTTFRFNDQFINMNVSGRTYVAYLFAHDDQSFGDDSDESIIKCGSYTGNGSTTGPEINLGWEPQWLLIKNIDDVRDWIILDSMRGIVTGGNDERLYPNSSTSESGDTLLDLTSTGFQLTYTGDQVNGSGENYIYIAIRRPMKTPESGTEVFAIDTRNGSGTSTEPNYQTNFPVDMELAKEANSTSNWSNSARLIQGKYLVPNATDAEGTQALYAFDYQNGWFASTATNANSYSWMFKRATGFFDVVSYTGDGVAGRTVNHNLGVAPEMIIVKRRDSSANWQVYASALGATKYLNLDLSNAAATSSSRWNDTEPTDTVFTTAASGGVNNSGGSFVAYLFATLAGVSKVGSYTGTGSPITVDCGFTSGARFIMIKRTDSTGDWIVFDSARGIVAGADPYLYLNSTAAESSTDAIDPDSSGFIVNPAGGGLNTSGGEYIFLAIA